MRRFIHHNILDSRTMRPPWFRYDEQIFPKLADLVVLAKNPLEDIRNTNTIRYVMRNGELFVGDTLNEVWPQQKPLAPLWWWNDHP